MTLEPCPFCGGTDTGLSNEYDVFGRWRVVCEGCGAIGPCEPVAHGCEDGAVEMWNTRNDPSKECSAGGYHEWRDMLGGEVECNECGKRRAP